MSLLPPLLILLFSLNTSHNLHSPLFPAWVTAIRSEDTAEKSESQPVELFPCQPSLLHTRLTVLLTETRTTITLVRLQHHNTSEQSACAERQRNRVGRVSTDTQTKRKLSFFHSMRPPEDMTKGCGLTTLISHPPTQLNPLHIFLLHTSSSSVSCITTPHPSPNLRKSSVRVSTTSVAHLTRHSRLKALVTTLN